VLPVTKFVLAAVGGSARNVEVGITAFVHQQDAAAHEYKEHHADDRYFQHAQEGGRNVNRSDLAIRARNGEMANTGTIENHATFGGEEMES